MQPTPQQIAEQQRNLGEREVSERRAAQKQWEQQAQAELRQRYANGAPTDRMRKAADLVRYLHAVKAGRWGPSAEEHVSRGGVLDGNKAANVATSAAQEAVEISKSRVRRWPKSSTPLSRPPDAEGEPTQDRQPQPLEEVPARPLHRVAWRMKMSVRLARR